MDRRAYWLASSAWLAAHCAALAQPARLPRVAMLNGTALDAAAQRLSVPASLRVSADEAIE